MPWLDTLCMATGGYGIDWRYLEAAVKECVGWKLKYIRFVRNSENPNEFIVCNSYFCPVEYRKIIDNIVKPD